MTSTTSVAGLAQRVRSAEPRLGGVRLVCVDGPAGAGKTTLADRLADVLGAPVVHLDDLYEGWAGLDGVWPRLHDGVLVPMAAGLPGRYQRYDWTSGAFAEWHEVPPADVLLVEGCGSAPRAADALTSLVVWVDAPPGLRLARGLERDGEHLRSEWLRWMAAEEQHHRRERTRDRADVVVDGAQPVPD